MRRYRNERRDIGRYDRNGRVEEYTNDDIDIEGVIQNIQYNSISRGGSRGGEGGTHERGEEPRGGEGGGGGGGWGGTETLGRGEEEQNPREL